MANLNLPVVGSDDNTWGEKVNAALTAINDELAVTGDPVDFYRRYVNGAWQVRGTDFPTIARVWVKHDTAIPNPPVDATYFKSGVDLLLMATA